ncbi:lonely Cys domain-containing protein [Streptomyces sp. NPDC047315]|uniref:lonely Cys domain-containing protein n=1 Tax=Streptomyces sp. NPDC047315 TaxID=3155142 RepID=UPI0033FFCD7C
MIPDSIEFPEEARWILFVLLGELPLQASSDMAFSSATPYDDKAGQVLTLRGELIDLLGKVDGALPPQVAASFKEALAPLTGMGGSDVLGDLAQEIRKVSGNRVKQSQKIMESKYEIIAEALILLAELAIIAALSVFTGGLSFTQTATAKARTTVAVLTIMQRLLNQTHLLSALSEAVQEALTALAVRLAMIALNDGKRRPDGIDGRDILKAFVVGGFAGFFGDVISKYIGDIFKNQFKNFGDNKWAVFGGNVFRNAASEGPSEGFAEFLVNGIFDGRWKFDLLSMAGGSVSAVTEMILSGALDHITKDLNKKFFDGRNVFATYNPPPGPNTVLGGGGGNVVVDPPRTSPPGPNAVTTTSSDGPASPLAPNRSLPPPPPPYVNVHTEGPPVVDPTLVSNPPTPLNVPPYDLPTGGVDPLPGSTSPHVATGGNGVRDTPLVINSPGPLPPPLLDTSSPSPSPATPVPGTTTTPVTAPVSPSGVDRTANPPSSFTPSPPSPSPSSSRTPEDSSQESPAQDDVTPAVTAPPGVPSQTPDPIRSEQWRPRMDAAPVTVVRTEVPVAPEDDGTDATDRTGGTEGADAPVRSGESNTVDTEVRRVQADDGRWVRSLTLDVPVRPGPGLDGVDLDDLRERVRVLLDTEVNQGLLLPNSGDQLHVDLSVVIDPGAAEAVEFSATAQPAPSDGQHIRLYGDDPALAPADRDRRRADNAVTVLRQLLTRAGLTPTADPATGPLVTPEALRTAESVTDVVRTDTTLTDDAQTDVTRADAATVPAVVRPSLESEGPGLGPVQPLSTDSEPPVRPVTTGLDVPRPLVTALGLPSEADSNSEETSSDDDSDVESDDEHPSVAATAPRTAQPRSQRQPQGLIHRHPPDYMLEVASGVGRLLYGLGYPVVLAGDARSRVQFANPRPLLHVDFELLGTALPTAEEIQAQLAPLSGPAVITVPDQDRAGTAVLMVNDVEIRIAVGTPAASYTTAPGFSLSSPEDSLADVALALATAADRAAREEALFNLLWALSRTPADGPRAAALLRLREDAYRAAAPPGAAPVLSVQLSEVLDAALNPDTLHQHEGLWADREASEDDEQRLTHELVALADELRVLPEVVADPVRGLAARLPGMSHDEITRTLAGLTPDRRERLAGDPALVNALRDALAPADFASVAADLIIQVPAGVHQPVSARESARKQVSRLLQDPEVTARLVKLGSRTVVVPRDQAVTSLEAFHDLKGQVSTDGRCFHTMRGLATLHAAISEENLLGELTSIGTVQSLPDGYSATLHEVSHIVHRVGLDYTDLGRINRVFDATKKAGEKGAWPDGVLYAYDKATGKRLGPNYSSLNQFEFFAQLTNVYFRANTGDDPVTRAPRNNGGPEWVKAKHPTLYPLLKRLYGPGPERSLKLNPVDATQALNEGLAQARALLGDGSVSDPDRTPDLDADRPPPEDDRHTRTPAARPGLYPPLAVPTQSADPFVEPHPDPVLEVGQHVARALHDLGRPAVLAGAARAVVQFDNPRPLDAVDFRLDSADLPSVDDIRRALERELPDARIHALPGPDGGGTLNVSVDGVTVRIAAGSPPARTVTADGFTLPAPAESVVDSALALATGSDRDLRGRDLLDLLWALGHTPADGPRAAALIRAGEDAYRATALPGAAPAFSVQLSEVLDAALDPDALADHEQVWTELGVDEADLPRLRAELVALATELRTRPDVMADPVRTLAARLPGMSTAEITHAVDDLTPDLRERLAGGPALVNALRDVLTPADFASVAAHLMVQVPPGSQQPVSARETARTEVARLLHDPEVTARLVKGGSRVVVVPRDESMTSLDAFKHLKGQRTDDGRLWDDVRGAGLHSAAVTEENLLGEDTSVGDEEPYDDGYSTTLHEVAHTVHQHGLDAADRQLILDAFNATDQLGEDGAWPDGALYSYDEEGERSRPNYSSLNEFEFFAQLTNVYLWANGGTDLYTGLPRNNGGPQWVKENQPELYPLLHRLYGPGSGRPSQVNPVHATRTEKESLAHARTLWGEPDESHSPQEHPGTATPSPTDGKHKKKYDGVRALWHAATGSHRPQPHPDVPAPAAGGKKRYEKARALWRTATGSRPQAAPPSPARRGTSGAPAPTELPELSAYARTYGARHDGHVGLVLFEPTPQTVLDGLYRQIADALGVRDGTPDAEEVRAQLADQLSAEAVERHRPELRGSLGHRITVRHGGRTRTVDVRLAHRDVRHSPRYYGSGDQIPPDTQVERRGEGAQGFTAVESSGTYRTISLPWSMTRSIAAGPVRSGDVTVTPSLTHNQLTQSIIVGETFHVTTKHNAKEPARPLDLDGLWQVRVDAPNDGSGRWQRPRSHGTLTGWFPEHRAVGDDSDPAGLPAPGPLDDLPLWGAESVGEPRRLHVEALAHRDLPSLRTLGPGSLQALEDFLSERNLRGSALQQTEGNVYSPVLGDAGENTVGVLQLIAHVDPQRPLLRSPDNKLALENYLARGTSVEQSAHVTSGLGLDVVGGPTFTDDDSNERTAGTGVGIGPQFRGGGAWKVDESLIGTATSTQQHGGFTTGGQLLTPATVTYELVLHLADGGRERATFGPWPNGLHLLVPPRGALTGHRPQGSEVRTLIDRLEHLASIGYADLPFRVDSPGLDAMLDDAERWLRTEGFLPPVQRPSGVRQSASRNERLRRAQLANLRRLGDLRTRLGRAMAMQNAVDGGHPLFFEQPAAVGPTRRVQLRLSTRRDTRRPTEHTRRLPDAHPLGFSGFEAGGKRQRGTALTGSLGFGFNVSIPVVDGKGTVTFGPEWTGSVQDSNAVSVGDVTGEEHLLLETQEGGDAFDVPALFELDLYEGSGDTPLIRFADGLADDVTGTAAVVDDRADSPPPALDGDGEAIAMVPLGPPAPRGVPGTVSLFVRHFLTRPATEAPAASAGHVVRRPVTDGSDNDDFRRLGIVDATGRPLPDVVPLADGMVVDSVRATAAIMDALTQVFARTHPGHVPPGRLTRAVRSAGTALSSTGETLGQGARRTRDLARQAVPAGVLGPVNRATALATGVLGPPLSRVTETSHHWGSAAYKRLSVAALGADRKDAGTLATETQHIGIRPGQLTTRAHQIFAGHYVLDALTLPGMAADDVLQVRIEGYLHHPRHLGNPVFYSEQSELSTVLAVDQHGVAKVHQFTGAFTGLRNAPAKPAKPVAQFNPTLRHAYSHRNDAIDAHTASTKVSRVHIHTGVHHLIATDITLLLTVRRGVRNVFGNTVGLGASAPVVVAVDVPSGMAVLAPEPVLLRYPRFYAFPQVTLPALPAPTLPPPDVFARTRTLAFGSVLSLTQLDDLRHRREQRDRLGTELSQLVEHEAYGITGPGHSSYRDGVAAEIARLTEPSALRTLPGRGSAGSAAQFVHFGYGGARLVEIVLVAEPVQQTPGLRKLRGRPVVPGGLEQVQSHAPQNRSATHTVTRTHQTTVAPVARYPRPSANGQTDREGAVVTLTRQRVGTVRNDLTGEDRLWTRTDTVGDFDVDYVITATVRSQLIVEWPANVPGGVFQAGLLSLPGLEGGVAERVTTWMRRLLAGRPGTSVSVPAAAVVRFAGAQSVPPTPGRAPLPPALHTADPLVPRPTAGPVPPAPAFDSPRLAPTGPTPVFHFDGSDELVRALLAVAPQTAASWGLSAVASAEANAARIGELVQTGQLSIDAPRTAAGLTPHVPGRAPLTSPAQPPTLSVALYDPRPVTGSADIAMDRVRREGAGSTTTGSAAESAALTYQSTHALDSGNRYFLAFVVPLVAQQAHASGYGGSATGNRLNRHRTARSTAPVDRIGTRTHATSVDAVFTVHGPKGTRWVTGTADIHLWEYDLIGFGVLPARPVDRAYDVPALLAGQAADDLRDWARHPLTDLPAALAAGLDPEDPSARLWLSLGDDADGGRLAHAVYAASRTAVLAGRPVEFAVRTADGPRLWPFAADGTPTDATAGTRAAWRAWQEAATAYDDAVDAQEQSAALVQEYAAQSVAATDALRDAEAELAAARTAHEGAQGAHRDAVLAADTALRTTARAVREAEAAHARAEAAVRTAEAMPTQERIDQARAAWQQAEAEARSAGVEGPGPTAELRARVGVTHRAWQDLAARGRGRDAAVSAAHTARTEAVRALDVARAEQERLRREGEAAVAEAVRVQEAAAQTVAERTRSRDTHRVRLDDVDLTLRDLRADQPARAAQQTDALRALARATGALDGLRRAEGTGASGSLLGSLSAAPAAVPGARSAPARSSRPGPAPLAGVTIDPEPRRAASRPRPHGRAALLRIAQRVTARDTAGDLSLEHCLRLLDALGADLYPVGARPGITLDDGSDGSIAPGPGWRRVPSWRSLAEAVTAAGPGAVAFVVTRGPDGATGRTWAAYHLGAEGVGWLDLSQPAGRMLSSQPPSAAVAEARAVVVDPSGQVLEGPSSPTLPPSPSQSTASSTVDAVTEAHRAGGPAPVIVTADGSEVPFETFALLRHQDAQGGLIGLSSRPQTDRQEAHGQTYGLLPGTDSFTRVRPGPIPVESAPEPLPFSEPFLVGLRGDASGFAPAVDREAPVLLGPNGLVDLVRAAAPELADLPSERPVFFPSTDLAGPAPYDPLLQPLPGQAVANGLGRWAWATAGGYEPVLVGPDADAPTRFQLAEGDDWAGFRPEPTASALARLAAEVTGDPARAPQVLGHLRAVRLIYGPHVEDDRSVLFTLLRGFQALEQGRADRGVTGPLTWRELRQSIAAEFTGDGQTEPAPPIGLPVLLAAAAGRAGVELPELSGLSPAPRHHAPSAWLSTPPDAPDHNENQGQDQEDQGTGPSDPAVDLFAPPAPAPTAAPPAIPLALAARPPAGNFTGAKDPLLAPGTVIRNAAGEARGRNLTGKPVKDPDLTSIRTIRIHPGEPSHVSTRPAPWPENAYVVAAPGGAGQAWLPDGRVLGPDALADLLAADPELAGLPADVPVLLVLPYGADGDQRLLRTVAHRLGRVVWGTSGDTRMVPDGDRYVPALADRVPGATVGSWLPADPALPAPSEEDREFTSVDGVRLRESEIDARPFSDDQDRQLGRTSVGRTPQARRNEERFRRFRHLRKLVHLTPAAGRVQDGSEEPISPPPSAVFVYAGHGEPGRLHVALKDGRTYWLGKLEAVRYLSGLHEVRNLPRGGRIHLEVCWSATDGDPDQSYPFLHAEAPHLDDPLDDVPLGQLLANVTRREVDAATRPTGLNDEVRLLLASASGVPGRRVLFLPEPIFLELDELARSGGLHTGPEPVSEETRRTTLRLVRALRREYGGGTKDPVQDTALWQGITALERLRANDERLKATTPFRLDLWDFYAEQHSGSPTDRAGRTALLDHARAVLAADPNAELSTAVPSRVIDATFEMLAEQGDAMLRYVQTVRPGATPTPQQWASTLWASARAAERLFVTPPKEEREALGRRILRLAPDVPWDRDRRQEVWALTARAAAQGLDIADPEVLTAYRLLDGGAFGRAAQWATGPQSPAGGVNWSGTPVPYGVAWQAPRQIVPGSTGTSVQPSSAPWSGPGLPYPRVYLVHVDQSGRIGLQLPDGTQALLTEGEFMALLGMDPMLRDLPLRVPAVFFTTGPGALPAGFAQRFAERTGRPAHAAAGPMMLAGAEDAPRTVLLLLDPTTKGPGNWTTGERSRPDATQREVALFAFDAPASDDETSVTLTSDGPDEPAGPTAPGTVQRTDDGGAALDGVPYALLPVPQGPGRANEAVVLAAVGDHPTLAELLPTAEPERSAAFRAWLAGALDGGQLTDAEVPSLDPSATLSLSQLEDAGHVLTDVQRTQGTLLGNLLPAGDVTVSSAVRLRLLLADPALGGPGAELPLLLLLTATARALDVTVAVAEAGADGAVVFVNVPEEGRTGDSAPPFVLLLRDGDRWFVGPPELERPERILDQRPRPLPRNP